MELATAHERYMRHHRAEGSSPETLRYHRNSIRQLIAYLQAEGEPTTLEDLRADHVRGWVEAMRERGLSQHSVATRVR